MATHSVLIVDDDDDIRFVAEMALADLAGFEVRQACSGEEALEVLAQGYRPSAVLLDVMMPGLGGVETLRRLRADAALAEIPVIFITAEVQRDQASVFLAEGAVGIIHKPFEVESLAEDIGALIAKAAG